MQGLSLFLAWILQDVIRYRYSTIRENLRNSFPDASQATLELTTTGYYRHLADLLLETIRFIRRQPLKMNRCVQITNPEVLRTYSGKGESVIILGGHIGNWEHFSSVMVNCGFETLAVYKPQSKPLGDQLMYRIRKKKGVDLVSMKDALRKFHRKLDEGKPVALLLVADQIPAKEDIHYWKTFMNQPTAWFTGGGKIAEKYHLQAFYLDVTKEMYDRYNIQILQLNDEKKPSTENSITDRYISLLEANIMRQPEIWLWSHRRWKYKAK